MFNEWDRRCTIVQLMLSTNPSYDNRTIASTLKMQIQTVQCLRVIKTKFPATVMVFGVVSSESHIMPPHIFKVGLKVNTKVYLDVLKSVVIPWCNQVADGRPWVWLQDSVPAHKCKETQAWLQKECYNSVPFSHWPPPPPTWTHWTTSFGHTSRTSPTWPSTTPKPAWSPPSAEYSPAPASACGKGMLPVPDPYRGVDWGWRWLHWIDVNSTTKSSDLNWFLQ